MARFIGRKEELDALESLYNKNGFQMTVIYGRRRIGKSTLIQEFIKGKRAVYYVAVKGNAEGNIQRWGKRIAETLVPDMPGMSLQSMDDIVLFLDSACREQRTVIVLDELPYLAEADKSFLSMLQNAIDEKWSKGQIMLILCGSSVSFMADEVLSEKSPLFGRRTSQLEIKAFNYFEAAEFVPDYTAEEKAICYGITGGVAKYLSVIEPEISLDENIIKQFFHKSGYLYEEPGNLLQQEYRNVSVYSDIIKEMAFGTNRVNDIADKTHNDATVISHALPRLMKTGIVSKDVAITDEKNNKKVQYNLSDHMFKFWYKFVPDGISAIELGQGETYYFRLVKPRLHEYMADVFEEMCRFYTLHAGITQKLNCFVTSVGKWWGANPVKKEQTDIDVVGLDLLGKKAVLGECKLKMKQSISLPMRLCLSETIL